MSNDQKTPKTQPKAEQNTSASVDQASRDLKDFKNKILQPYLEGKAELELDADALHARSLLPPGTAQARSFASLAFDYPHLQPEKCVACMECVVECPDAAIYARVSTEDQAKEALDQVADPAERGPLEKRFTKTQKFWTTYEKRKATPGLFSLWIDPDKCKGCGECAAICAHDALIMTHKESLPMHEETSGIKFAKSTLPPTRQEFINDKLLVDLFLMDDHWVYKGGAGACKGCGEITALRMALTATSSKYGKNMAIVAATGCNSVFSSTYPYNIFEVPWTNPLFENAPATGLGVRLRLNQIGRKDTKVWVVGGDGAMGDIGFQSLSRMLVSGEDIKVLVLDTQVYSNTGGQASTSTFLGQNAKMSTFGRQLSGKRERRKELGPILLAHPDVFVAQVSPAFYNHFLRAVLSALEFPGPAVILAYSPCMPEHGIADHTSFERSRAAVLSRAFPLFIHDPRAGESYAQRLDLRGNPSLSESWHKDPKTGEVYDFVWFARQEERFSKLFNKDGTPTELLIESQSDRAKNWDRLRDLARLK